MKTVSKLGLVTAMLMAGSTGSVWAASLVQVSLWDKGARTEMPMGLAYAAPNQVR